MRALKIYFVLLRHEFQSGLRGPLFWIALVCLLVLSLPVRMAYGGEFMLMGRAVDDSARKARVEAFLENDESSIPQEAELTLPTRPVAKRHKRANARDGVAITDEAVVTVIARQPTAVVVVDVAA